MLGSNNEALDPIRIDTSCYIVFNRLRSKFEIMGKTKDVQEAIVRLRITYFQVVARRMTSVKTYLLQSSKLMDPKTHISLVPYDGPITPKTCARFTMQKNLTVRAEPPSFDTDLEVQSPIVGSKQTVLAQRIRNMSVHTLRKLRHYSGNVHVRAKLGAFVLERYKEPQDGESYTVSEFENMLTFSQFSAMVTEE